MWDKRLFDLFAEVPINAPGNDYVASYHQLLNYLFSHHNYFMVAPSFHLLPNTDKRIATWEISFLGRPVLYLQLQDPSMLEIPSERQAADDRMRSHVLKLAESCPFKTLHAVSAFGRELHFYSVSDGKSRLDELKEGIISLPFARDPPDVNDAVSQSHKGYDVLESDGEERLRRIVAEIKTECAPLEARFRERASAVLGAEPRMVFVGIGFFGAEPVTAIVDSLFRQDAACGRGNGTVEVYGLC